MKQPVLKGGATHKQQLATAVASAVDAVNAVRMTAEFVCAQACSQSTTAPALELLHGLTDLLAHTPRSAYTHSEHKHHLAQRETHYVQEN